MCNEVKYVLYTLEHDKVHFACITEHSRPKFVVHYRTC